MKMAKEKVFFALVGVFLCLWSALGQEGLVIRKEERRVVSVSESGSISAIDVRDWIGGANYHLQFITMEPNSLFLPVILHSDMVFYVHSGRAKINYIEKESSDSKNKKKESSSDESKSIDVEHGDVYRLQQGTTFYITSYPAPTRVKFRIYAIFNTADVEDPREQLFGAYSNLTDLVRGFDERILQTGFGVSEDLVQSIKWAERTPAIVPYVPKSKSDKRTMTDNTNWKEGIIESVVESMVRVGHQTEELNKKKKSESRTFNFYSGKPDVKNCYGWSTAITHNELEALESIDIGAFMVNLTTGSMMGPHWNPKATEISVVIHGQGMIQIVCPTNAAGQFTKDVKCKNSLYRVKEGDVFIVPKYHPMTQISFNNDSFVFMGFSTNARNNYPQFLAGDRSVLKEIDSKILKAAFGAPNTTVVEELLSSQHDAIILGCTSCGEDLMEKAEEEERQRAEKQRRREEKRREEEERRREEEEARRREEEKARRREEEEARRREEEKTRRREEERARREEEEARRREEEQARKREEEQAREREEEQEEARRREEEQARREEEEEEARRREEEEQEARRREEEEQARKREEEEERKEARRREKEQARREEEARRREEARREEEEQARREEEEGEQWVRKNLKGWK